MTFENIPEVIAETVLSRPTFAVSVADSAQHVPPTQPSEAFSQSLVATRDVHASAALETLTPLFDSDEDSEEDVARLSSILGVSPSEFDAFREETSGSSSLSATAATSRDVDSESDGESATLLNKLKKYRQKD